MDSLGDAQASSVLEERTQTLELEAMPPAGPWLLEIGWAHGVRSIPLASGERIALGSGRDASLRIPDAAVSALHVKLEATDMGVRVEDLGSRNGIYVGGVRVERALLRGAGASFVIGRTTISVRKELGDDELGSEQPVPGLIGSSAPMRRLASDIRRYANLRGPVLLLGESGTGKDVVARALHAHARRSGAYVPINVGAITESLADAELFGHQRGAFTGAVASRAGAFEQAHKGTLLLDELGELSPVLQVKLLRVVEDGCVRPVGGVEPVRVDVRIVSATCAPLAERIEAGRFRPDLYHRLSTFVLRLPALRERKSDIPALTRALLERVSDEIGPRRLSSSALARLVAHAWPGNVRELASVLYRAAVAAETEEIAARHVDLALPARRQASLPLLTPDEALSLLRQCRGNVSAASRAARVPRSTFRGWVDRALMRRTR